MNVTFVDGASITGLCPVWPNDGCCVRPCEWRRQLSLLVLLLFAVVVFARTHSALKGSMFVACPRSDGLRRASVGGWLRTPGGHVVLCHQ